MRYQARRWEQAVGEGPHRPSLQLLVTRGYGERGVRLGYRLHSPDPRLAVSNRSYGTVELVQDPLAYVRELYRDLEDRLVDGEGYARSAVDWLRPRGAKLFRHLLPEALQEALWSLHDDIGSLEVISDEPWIPWELLCFPGEPVARPGRSRFFGETFPVTRWLTQGTQRLVLPLTRIAVVHVEQGLPPGTGRERDFLRSLASEARDVRSVPPDHGALLEALGSGRYDGWHFICHGQAEGDDADRWCILLDDRQELTPDDLHGEAMGLGRSSPLVFLNACNAGRGGFSLAGVGGWARQFLEAGAGAFIGPLWSVRDSRASRFAETFYRELVGGETIARAAWEARRALRESYPGDASWLAYAVFAAPAARCPAPVAVTEQAEPVPGPGAVTMRGEDPTTGERTAEKPDDGDAEAGGEALPDRRDPSAGPAVIGNPPAPVDGASAGRVHERDGTRLVYVRGGLYTLGAEDLDEWSGPVHRVHLDPFWIGELPVTNEQYARFLEVEEGHLEPHFWHDERFNQPRQPVVGVSWEEAWAYCRWAGLELPSEAQWEAAARGLEGLRYPWGSAQPGPEHANFGNAVGHPTEAGAYPAGRGPYGTLDQAGNVWEWCVDAWSRTAYEARGNDRCNPVGQGDEAVRVVRGGSWLNPACDLRAAYRDRATARMRLNNQGFRCLLPATGRAGDGRESWSVPPSAG